VLAVLRRPPGPPEIVAPAGKIKPMGYTGALELLDRRASEPSWVDEKESLLNAGNLEAYHASLADGSEGWMVYQNTVFQLGRIVIQTERGDPLEVGRALLHHLHCQHPAQDTKTENLPLDDPHLPVFRQLGYLDMFLRIELVLSLR
jgi:hypothetical protein